MKKNYPHNIIRLRRGKKVKEQIFHIIAILNKRKEHSQKITYKLGYIQFGKKMKFTICVCVATIHVFVDFDQDISTMPSYGHGKHKSDVSGLYIINCLLS